MPLVPEETRSVIDFNPEGAAALLGAEAGRYVAEHLHPVQAARLLPHVMKHMQARYGQQNLPPPTVQFISRERAHELLLAAMLRKEPPEGSPPLSPDESAAVFACFSAREVRLAMGGEHRAARFPLTPETQTRLDEILDISYQNRAFQACGAAVAEGARIARANGFTVVQWAAREGELERLVPLLSEGGAQADALMSTITGSNPMQLAAEQGSAAAVDVLHAAGVPVDAMTAFNLRGFAPVHLAASKGHASFVRALGRHLTPEQLMVLSANDMSAADCAGKEGHAAVLDALSDSGVSVAEMVRPNEQGYTTVHHAADRGYVRPRLAARETDEQRDQRLEGSKQVIDTLVRLGMPRTVATLPVEHGFTAFHLATHMGNVPALRAMYDASLDPAAVMAGCRRHGMTPATIAADHRQIGVIKFLLHEARLPLEQVLKPTSFGNTPLHYAASRGDVAMINAFVLAGADPEALMCKNSVGLTPLDFAHSNGHLTVVKKAFLEAGVRGWDLLPQPSSFQAAAPAGPAL